MINFFVKLTFYTFIAFFVAFLLYLPIMLFEIFRKPPRSNNVRIWFGRPGSGKSTFAASFVMKKIKKGIPVWSNVPIKGAYILNVNDIGVYKISNGHIIIDEAGIDYNNRQFAQGRSMSPAAIDYWKKIRHAGCLADVFSQSYEDMDIILRRIAGDIYLIRRSIFPRQFVAKKIRFSPDVDNLSHKIVDYYRWGLPIIHTYRVFGPMYWKAFDSYDMKELPEKEWEIYGDNDIRPIQPENAADGGDTDNNIVNDN